MPWYRIEVALTTGGMLKGIRYSNITDAMSLGDIYYPMASKLLHGTVAYVRAVKLHKEDPQLLLYLQRVKR